MDINYLFPYGQKPSLFYTDVTVKVIGSDAQFLNHSSSFILYCLLFHTGKVLK